MEPAQSQPFSEPLLAAMPQLREKLHLGVPSSNPALYLGHEVCKSTTALGLRAALHLERVQSRSTGKERGAESGNDYFGARYYGSSMGRFMSPDDGSDQDPSDPQSWNLYGYARNNPLVNTDPSGRACIVGGDGSRSDDNSGGESCADVDRNNAQNPVASVVVHANGDSDNGFDPGSLGAGVFGSAQNSTWKNTYGVVNTAAGIEMTGIAIAMPEMFAADAAPLATGVAAAAKNIGRAARLRKLFGTEGPGAIKGNPEQAARQALSRLQETGQLPEGITQADLDHYRQIIDNAARSTNPNGDVQSVREQIVDLAEKLIKR
jgi:RHS repeat-associated protein